MFKINCPRCGRELEVQEEWQGMESSCPLCNGGLIIPVLSAPPAPKKKKWLIPVIAGGAAVIVAVVLLIVLLPGKSDSIKNEEKTAETTAEKPAAQPEEKAAAQPEEKAAAQPEVDENVQQLRAAFRAESPDLKEITALMHKVPDPQVYEHSLVREFDRQYGKASSYEAKIQLFEAVSSYELADLADRKKRLYEEIGSDLHNAIEELNFAKVKLLYPLIRNVGHPRLAQAKILIDAEPIMLRRDADEIRKFIAACPDAYIKGRLQSKFNVNVEMQGNVLYHNVQRALSRGDLPEAERNFAELKKIAPNNKRTIELEKRLQEIRKNPAPANRNNHTAPPGRGGFHGGRSGMHRGGRPMPIHIRVTRACMMGQREEVKQLMEQKPDLHRVLTVVDSSTNVRSKVTVFQSLLNRGKNMASPRREAFISCLIVILESGFKPNADERKFMEANYPELIRFIR